MTENKLPIIEKVEPHYCGNDCVQLMFKYDKALCIAKRSKSDDEEREIVFYNNKLEFENRSKYINKYVTDERRNQFSYCNLPIHTERIKFKKYTIVNQLLDYDTIYEIMRGNEHGIVFTYCKVIKDGDSAIVIQDRELSSAFYMNNEELKQYLYSKNEETSVNKSSKEEVKKQKKLIKK